MDGKLEKKPVWGGAVSLPTLPLHSALTGLAASKPNEKQLCESSPCRSPLPNNWCCPRSPVFVLTGPSFLHVSLKRWNSAAGFWGWETGWQRVGKDFVRFQTKPAFYLGS